MPHARPLVLAAVLSAALAGAGLLAGCNSAVSGSGSGASSSTTGSARSPDFPAGSGSPATTGGSLTSAAPDTPATTSAPQPKSRLTVTGTSSGKTYQATIWASDDISDCATHAYGEQMIRFLGAHPCRGAHRVLATIPLGGRTVAISAISTSFVGTPSDPYVNTSRFEKLEQANGTGSINDLLREGATLPGATKIPAHEAFKLLGQDAGVTIFDAWYLTGTTRDQDPTLVTLEMDLFLSSLTSA